MKLSIVIPSYNRKEKIIRLIESIICSYGFDNSIEIIVVDNGSTDGTQSHISYKYKMVKILQQKENTYCGGARNIGASHANGELIFFIDDDNILQDTCIHVLLEFMNANHQVGVVGPLMLDFNDKNIIWCGGGKLTKFGMPVHLYAGKNYKELDLPAMRDDIDYLPNAFMVRKSVFNKDHHDTTRFPHNWSEQDLCKRIIDSGHKVAVVYTAVTEHDFGIKRRITRVGIEKTYDQARSRILFRRMYINNFQGWIAFILIIFPSSTLYYMKVFATEHKSIFFKLIGSYFRGTIRGLTQKK